MLLLLLSNLAMGGDIIAADVTVNPGDAIAIGHTSGPTVILGSLVLNPGNAIAIGHSGNPTFSSGSLTVTVGNAIAIGTTSIQHILIRSRMVRSVRISFAETNRANILFPKGILAMIQTETQTKANITLN